MEFLKTILKDVENADELIASIKAELPKHFIPKEKYNSKSEEAKELKGRVTSMEEQLETLKSKAGDSEELQKQITDLQEANKQKEAEYTSKLEGIQKSQILEKALRDNMVKENYLDLVKGAFKIDDFKLTEDGRLIGLDEEIKRHKEQYADLWGEMKVAGTEPTKGLTPDNFAAEYKQHHADPDWYAKNRDKVFEAMEKNELPDV